MTDKEIELRNKKDILVNLSNLVDMNIKMCKHLGVINDYDAEKYKDDLCGIWSMVNDIEWELMKDDR